MSLPEAIFEFLHAPFPLWENRLTRLLVAANPLGKLAVEKVSEEGSWLLMADASAGPTYLSAPSVTDLPFYEENGLLPQSALELSQIGAAEKIQRALELLGWEEAAKKCIAQLIRSIHVVGSPNDEIDVSHSDPDLIATIFVSVCQGDHLVSRLRVAESILHEAMHLKLSLIERAVPLTMPFTGNLYFSPWRDEGRPAQGIIHGLFVFRAILEFFRAIKDRMDQKEGRHHLEWREQEILREIELLNNFGNCPDLTPAGAILTASLINLEYCRA